MDEPVEILLEKNEENKQLCENYADKEIFSSATLNNANFNGANLTNANLRSTNIIGATFVGANTNGADFTCSMSQ